MSSDPWSAESVAIGVARKRRRRIRARRLRRILLALGVLAAILMLSARPLIERVSGSSPWHAVAGESALSPVAGALVQRTYSGLDPTRLVDVHTHLVGLGTGASGCWASPRMQTWLHPADRVRFLAYLSAADVHDLERADEEYVEKLSSLARAVPHPMRHVLLPFDYSFAVRGERQADLSPFHVPDAWARTVSRREPGLFIPAASIHPCREDALEALEEAHAAGVKLIKWIPQVHNIPVSGGLSEGFYEALARHDIALLVHTGEERAMTVVGVHDYGNPLRLRAPLNAGVKVIAAHCASSGEFEDHDAQGVPGSRPMVSAFELFLRLMDEERYEGLLFGEISTITQVNRYSEALPGLLARPDLHGRLVNGSDWPLPGIDVLYSTRRLVADGFLAKDDAAALEELYDWNPLLYDLALKRMVRHPETGQRFSAETFHCPPELGL